MTREDEARELLACPFCGNDGSGGIEDALHIIFNEHDWRDHSWSVQCDKCTATMGYFDSEDDAVEAWNTRPSSPASVEVERVARAMCPIIFGSPDDQVGPATRSEREKLRDYARAAIAALTVQAGEVEEQKPGAWRWRYVYKHKAGPWKVRQTPVEPHPATQWLPELQVQPLYASLPTARADIGEVAAQHFKVGDRVTKVKGLPFGNGDARVVAVYSAEGGSRVVVQHPEGWQHIFAPDQLALASLQSSGRDAGEERLKEALEQAFRAGHEAGFDAAENTSRSQQSHENDAWGEYVASLKDHAK